MAFKTDKAYEERDDISLQFEIISISRSTILHMQQWGAALISVVRLRNALAASRNY